MNIDTMDGYEFEELIYKLFRNMNFDVEHTSLSGDGGIDLIAYSNQLLYKGKYIIQCKRYSGSVGEPAIRDLYGVVLSESANKGILITNSTFTKQAVAFAEGKNIELIDGTLLCNLLGENGLLDITSGEPSTSFIDVVGFDKNKYFFLSNQIKENKKAIQSYERIVSFLLDNLSKFIDSKEFLGNYIDKIIYYCDEIIRRFGGESKTKKTITNTYSRIKIAALMIIGNIENAFQIANNIQLLHWGVNQFGHSLFIKKYIIEYIRNDLIYSREIKYADVFLDYEIAIRDFMIFFIHYNFIRGFEYLYKITNTFSKSPVTEENEASAKNNQLYQLSIRKIKSGAECRIFIPIVVEGQIKYSEDRFVIIDSVASLHHDKESVQKQISNIEYLI